MNYFTVFDSDGRVKGGYSSSIDFVLHQLTPGDSFLTFAVPERCLYVKHTENGWEPDFDRKPEMPEPGCVWEYPRWVTPGEQTARHNAALQTQLDTIDYKKTRAISDFILSRNETERAAATARLEEFEQNAKDVRQKWKHKT
ncbi:MAG: hypothetical protein ACRCVX_14690 [Shewanella sp.]